MMLVLSRKFDQAVVIGGLSRFAATVRVTVLEIAGGRVKLGFETAKDIPVHREEVWERLRASQPGARLVSDPALTVSRNGKGKTRALSGE